MHEKEAFVERCLQRLRAAGWEVGEHHNEAGTTFWAVRDGGGIVVAGKDRVKLLVSLAKECKVEIDTGASEA